jgi:hypothetical protein
MGAVSPQTISGACDLRHTLVQILERLRRGVRAELRPELVALVRQLRRPARPKGGQGSLRDISAELAQRAHLNERGVPFSAASINSMLAR